MEIRLYINNSEQNKFPKSLTNIATINGKLKDSTSIINPTLLLDFGPEILNCNYMYIVEFGRYYFINDIVNIHNNLWAISGHVDVLNSFSTQILNNEALIDRQENIYDNYIPDPEITMKSDSDVIIKELVGTKSFTHKNQVIILNSEVTP